MMSSWLLSLIILMLNFLIMMTCIWMVSTLEVYSFLSKTMMDLLMLFDSNTLVFFTGVILISFLVFLWSLYYMLISEKLTSFFVILSLFVTSMLLLVLSNSFFVIFMGWEGLGLTSFLLIIFYQNWTSFQGGLLTLLTNRLGDAIMMMSFSYWIIINNSSVSFYLSTLLMMMFVFLTLTKSAQVPFTSWLPAAMAAPTPVSALVHSSTLVTAGIWLMIRFGGSMMLNLLIWLIIGLSTLLMASSAALMENDAKKVVALSTLSQLGLMFVALFLGGAFITLFHLLMHAMAKANLFLMVGNMLHSRFSQQDTRMMSSGLESPSVIIMMMISLFSLSGMTFTSGFLSKDMILNSHYNLMNSIMSNLLVIGIITLTAAYCFKLMKNLMLNNSVYLSSSSLSIMSLLPSILMSSLSLMMGWLFLSNMTCFKMMYKSISGIYWTLLLLVPLFLLFKSKILVSLFKSQVNLINIITLETLLKSKLLNLMLSSTMLESVYLKSSLLAISFIMMGRTIMMLAVVGLVMLMF